MTGKLYEIRVTGRAEKDIKKLTHKLRETLYDILTELIAKDPYQGNKLIGDLEGSYSCRLSYKDRIVSSIDTEKGIVYIERAKTHYED